MLLFLSVCSCCVTIRQSDLAEVPEAPMTFGHIRSSAVLSGTTYLASWLQLFTIVSKILQRKWGCHRGVNAVANYCQDLHGLSLLTSVCQEMHLMLDRMMLLLIPVECSRVGWRELTGEHVSTLAVLYAVFYLWSFVARLFCSHSQCYRDVAFPSCNLCRLLQQACNTIGKVLQYIRLIFQYRLCELWSDIVKHTHYPTLVASVSPPACYFLHFSAMHTILIESFVTTCMTCFVCSTSFLSPIRHHSFFLTHTRTTLTCFVLAQNAGSNQPMTSVLKHIVVYISVLSFERLPFHFL